MRSIFALVAGRAGQALSGAVWCPERVLARSVGMGITPSSASGTWQACEPAIFSVGTAVGRRSPVFVDDLAARHHSVAEKHASGRFSLAFVGDGAITTAVALARAFVLLPSPFQFYARACDLLFFARAIRVGCSLDVCAMRACWLF